MQMKKTLLALAAMLGFAAPLSAWVEAEPCGWGFQAEFIYLYTSTDDNYFAVDSRLVSVIDGTREHENPKWNPGFRIEGVYGFENACQDTRIRYTYLEGGQSLSFSSPSLFSTMEALVVRADGGPGTGSYKNKAIYHNLEWVVDQKLFTCPLDLWLRAGLQYNYIRVSERAFYSSALGTGTVTYKERMYGVGPQLGFAVNYDLCSLSWCCMPGQLSFTGLTTTSLLAANCRCTFNDDVAPTVFYNVKDEPTWRLVPEVYIRMGLNYDTCFWCTEWSLEIGYEFTSFFNALPRTRYLSDTAGASFTYYSNFDLHGPYVALGVSF